MTTPAPLHAINYAWPNIDGYTVRSIGLVGAQAETLGWRPHVAVSPFAPLAGATDGAFATDHWGPASQSFAGDRQSCDGGPTVRGWERPDVGLAPATTREHARHLRTIATRHGATHVHAHHPAYNAGGALAAAREAGLPAIYELRCFNGDYDLGEDASAYERARGRWRNVREVRLARRADAVVTIADGLAERLARAGVPEDRLFVVRNAVDMTLFAPRPRPAPSEVVRVGYATTFEAMENLDAAARAAGDAAAILAKEGKRLTLTIAGRGRDWDRISGIVAEEGLGDVVSLPGFVPYGEMPAFYADLDLFLVPRRAAPVAQDTTPLKPLEAASVGVPLAVSDLPALRALLGDDVRRFAPTREGIRDALLDFARAPWEAHADVSGRAWSSEIRRYEAVYEAADRNHRDGGER